ncbi:hypothetical protein EVG20_g4779 [Dentipellis fragilis]|uniref:Uncharacterized protein n=1 Tax=Dentipellis fragilis TaxID=205917 RepID=A0A4Y9YYW1_9AGAM|nr:hypothetical protein EVG20_g4779 [Dentipellis fragilis]
MPACSSSACQPQPPSQISPTLDLANPHRCGVSVGCREQGQPRAYAARAVAALRLHLARYRSPFGARPVGTAWHRLPSPAGPAPAAPGRCSSLANRRGANSRPSFSRSANLLILHLTTGRGARMYELFLRAMSSGHGVDRSLYRTTSARISNDGVLEAQTGFLVPLLSTSPFTPRRHSGPARGLAHPGYAGPLASANGTPRVPPLPSAHIPSVPLLPPLGNSARNLWLLIRDPSTYIATPPAAHRTRHNCTDRFTPGNSRPSSSTLALALASRRNKATVDLSQRAPQPLPDIPLLE